MTPEKRALDLLDRAYENLKEADELEAFLLCVKDYVEYIQKTPVFVAVIGELDGQKSKWMDELEGLEEKALKELEIAEKFILPFVKEKPNEEDGRSFMFGVTGLRMYKEGKTDMAGLKSRNIENFLFEIVKDLPQADKDKILKRYSDKDPVYQNIYGNFCFSESGKRLQERLSDFNIKRKVEVWGCWDFVKLIPKVIPALHTDNTMTLFAEQFSYLDQDLINEYVRLIMTIRNGEAMRNHDELVKTPETIKEYKNYAARVNTYLLKEISEREPSGYTGEPAKSDLQILGGKLDEAFADDKTSIWASRAWFDALANDAKPALEKYQQAVAQTLINLEPFRRRLAENAKIINQISQSVIMPNLEAVKPMLKEIEDSANRVSKLFDQPQKLMLTAPLPPKISEAVQRNEIANEIRALRIEVEKLTDNKTSIAPQQPLDEAETQNKRPFCVIDGKWGFLKFSKQGQKIKISNANSQAFKLLQCLTEPFGTAKSVDTVFEAIREGVKYKSKSGVYTRGTDKAQKIKLIEYAIKELQKGNKLQGKLAFKWDELKNRAWLEYLG